MPEPKRGEAGSLSKFETQTLQRLNTQGCAAFWSVGYLVKTSIIPISKVRQFLHTKASYSKFTSTTRKFKRLEAFVGFKNGIWQLDIAAFVVEFIGVKYSLVRQDLFGRMVDAEGKKAQFWKKTNRVF